VSRDAVVVGSGAAGSVAALELARAGWSVTVVERGRHLRPGLGEVPGGEVGTLYGSDEIKGERRFGFPDARLEPYTTRTQDEARDGVARSAVGALGQLGAAVGGTSLHYNAKVPRFWRQDFNQLSEMGPIEGAQVADWPHTYEDLAPFYDEVEARLGVNGDVTTMPARTLEQSPRGPYAMPPLPISHAVQRLAEGARRTGLQPYHYPAAVNSQEFDGRPACRSCGLCSGFGCPINARGDALVSFLAEAMLTGRVRLLSRAWAHRVLTTPDGSRATGVRYRQFDGRDVDLPADVVVLAGSPINTARLLLLSSSDAHPDGLGNRSGQVGRNMMFHNFVQGAAVFAEDVHPLRSQSTTLQVDDLIGPRRDPEVLAAGLPYVKGGLMQLGGAAPLLIESATFAGLVGYGDRHKQLMRFGALHARGVVTQVSMEDLPQAENRVDLDPGIRDFLGFPAARITYSPHRHEKVFAGIATRVVQAMSLAAPGAIAAATIPFPLLSDGIFPTYHLGGTARMGVDPETTVCDAEGRLHECQNVVVADGSAFPTFPSQNPTLSIMAHAMRVTRALVGGTATPAAPAAQPAAAPSAATPVQAAVTPATRALPATGGRPLLPLVAVGAVGAAGVAVAATRAAGEGDVPAGE
jgi:choline dehydrogenase-like flavoprotein